MVWVECLLLCGIGARQLPPQLSTTGDIVFPRLLTVLHPDVKTSNRFGEDHISNVATHFGAVIDTEGSGISLRGVRSFSELPSFEPVEAGIGVDCEVLSSSMVLGLDPG